MNNGLLVKRRKSGQSEDDPRRPYQCGKFARPPCLAQRDMEREWGGGGGTVVLGGGLHAAGAASGQACQEPNRESVAVLIRYVPEKAN